MATYYTDRTTIGTAGNTSTYIPARVDGRGLVWQAFSITIGTALATNDIIQLVTIPAGATILDGLIASGGTQGANSDSTFKVGDGSDDDRFLTTTQGIVLRSGGGTSRFNPTAVLTGVNYTYTSEDTIDLTVAAQGTGQTTGGYIKGYVLYAMGS